MNLSNNVYDKLKFLVQVLMPGLAALYVGLAQLYTWGNTDVVVGTIALLATFLGLFLSASARQYEGAGDLIVQTDPNDGEVYLHTNLKKHPSAFKNKKNVTLNVVQMEDAAA